jgi:tetratricopeptide (TPR) repeat protein
VIDRGARDEADDLIARLRDAALPEPLLDFLDARALAGRGRWREAAAAAERARPGLRDRADLTVRADLLLGLCCERLGDLEGRFAAFHRAAEADPTGEAACLGLGAALEALGRSDEALAIYDRIAAAVPRARLRQARILLVHNRKLGPAERRWGQVEKALDEVARALPDEDEVPVLRAEVLAAAGKGEEAYRQLAAARDRRRDRVRLWLALAALAERQGKTAAAREVLDEAGSNFKGSLEVTLARAAFWTRQEPARARPALERLVAEAAVLPPADRDRMWRGLAEAYAAVGAAREAAGLWGRLAERLPDDPDVRLDHFEAVLQSAGPAAAEGPFEQIRRVDGPDGDLTRYARARLLLARARAGERGGLAEARSLLEAVAARRPGWGRVPLCRAQLCEAEGDAEGAITRYQEAVEAGEGAPPVLRRLTEMLAERRRYGEAEQTVRLLPERSTLAGELRRRVAVAARAAGDPVHAAELAEQAVPADSKDPRDHLWLGQMLFSAGKNDRAEERLRRALDLSEAAADPWVAAVVLEARVGRREKAEELITEAARKLPPAKRDLALAQCYEAVGRPELARAHVATALAARPGDAIVLWAAVRYSLRAGEPAAAEPLLRKILGNEALPADQAARARRMLAVVLASQTDYRKIRQALVYLDLLEDRGEPDPDQKESADDLRVKVFVLAMQRTRPMRQRAIKLLEYLAEHEGPTPDDEFFMAQLYEAVGDWPKARERMVRLLARGGDDPGYLTYLTRGLVRHEGPAGAKPWLMKLEAVRPDAFQTLELRCRVLKAEGKARQAAGLVEAYALRHGADLEGAGGLLEELGQAAAAEAVFSRFAGPAGRPENRLVLAAFLARQRRLAEALDLCEASRRDCPLESVAVVSVAALSAARWRDNLGLRVAVQYSAPWDDKQGRRVEAWLEEVVRREPNKGGLRAALAALRSLQGRYAEAEDLYRSILTDNSHDALALNNLAWLLAMGEGAGKARKALELLRHAEELTGPLPDLLDTLAVAHLALEEDAPAVAILEEVTAESPTAVGYFHLARAYDMGGNHPAGCKALAKATELGLQADRLHPKERVVLQRMLAEQTPR